MVGSHSGVARPRASSACRTLVSYALARSDIRGFFDHLALLFTVLLPAAAATPLAAAVVPLVAVEVLAAAVVVLLWSFADLPVLGGSALAAAVLRLLTLLALPVAAVASLPAVEVLLVAAALAQVLAVSVQATWLVARLPLAPPAAAATPQPVRFAADSVAATAGHAASLPADGVENPYAALVALQRPRESGAHAVASRLADAAGKGPAAALAVVP